MAEFNVDMRDLRRYEVSIWTLQDRFLSILKWYNLEQKGQIQEPQITLKDDGTQEFNFSIPKMYYDGDNKILNPTWYQLQETPLEANMHKLKVVFNKNIEQQQIENLDSFIIKLKLILLNLFNKSFNLTEQQFLNENNEPITVNEAVLLIENTIRENATDSSKIIEQKLDRLKKQLNLVETILEFLVVSVVDNHNMDEITIQVKAEGLAFHELGKIGYKIVLNEQDFLLDSEEWFRNNPNTENEDFPEDIHYWNKKIFGDTEQDKKTNWYYKIDMDWSSHSYASQRRIDQVYEDEYVSSWDLQNGKLTTKSIEGMRIRWATIDVKESNIYNITQTIAENFGVFCRYEYIHDENYNIIGRYVVYYNNYIQDRQGHMDLTYPYTSSGITRTVDASNITTKLFVRAYEGQETGSDRVTIMDVGANRSGEDYLLNFDYLYKIGTITQEQYDAIGPYEAALYELNQDLSLVGERIRVLTNELSEWEAKYTIAKNAINLDDERWNEANDAAMALTNNEGEIPVESSSAAIKDINHEGYYYLNLSYKGIRSSSVHLYKKFNSKTKTYSEEITGWRFEEDEYHNITKIIGLDMEAEESKIIYYKLSYNPELYWEKVMEIWAKRKLIDLADYEEAREQIARINSYLWGMRVDYGKVDETILIGGYYLQAYVDGQVNQNTLDVEYSRVDECRINSSEYPIDIDEINARLATPDLYYNQRRLKNEKEILINRFNRMMGPALREGYWQPDEVHDYGDMFQDWFMINPNHYGGTKIEDQGYTSGYVKFIWDSEKYYDNELPYIFEASTDGTKESYIAINLTNYMDIFRGHFDNLAFFYYDLDVLTTLYQLDITHANRDDWIQSLEANAMRSFEVGSQCELGWLKHYSQKDNFGEWIEPDSVIPVLILTGAKSLDHNTLEYIATGKFNYGSTSVSISNWNSSYLPFIGYYDVQQEDQGRVNLIPIKLVSMNYGTNSPFIYPSVNKNLNDTWPTYKEFEYQRAYPRLYFNTLRLKSNGTDFEMKLNNRPVKINTDYYVISDDRSIGLGIKGIGYYATIRSEVLFRLGNIPIKINLLFTLSNIDTSIYLDAVKVAKENAFPKVSYDVQLSVLNPDFVKTAYNTLNQIVQINDNDLQLDEVNGYISSITLNLDKPWEDQVEIKNYETKFEDLFSTIVAQTEAMKKSENGINTAIRAFGANGLITEKVLQDSIRAANLELAFNQGKLTISEEKGIWAISDDGGVVAIRGGGIFTATDQDADGKYIWNTGILPSGINASLITSGQLDTNLIKIYSGDQLRFQWNGEGLYAYKLTDNYNNQAILDKTQYVVYNSEGLFLRNEAVSINNDPTNIWSVDRVEISWEGLILRNNNNDKTFFADPDSGDLTLIGKITANSGTIAGWTILADSLQKEGIGLYSDTQDYGPGIVLSERPLQTIETVIGDTPYYTYKDKNNVNQKYYLNRSSTTEITLSANDTVYKYQQEIISVEPKYQISAAEVQSGTQASNNITDGVVISNSATSVNTIIYVGENSSTQMQYNNEPIIYDFNNIPDRTRNNWYDKVILVKTNSYKNFVNEITGYNYVQISVKNLPGNNANSTLTLQPEIQGKPTFSVYARDGATTIRKGTIGNFTIEDNALRGGTLLGTKIDNSSYFIANGQNQRFDKLFYDIQSDSDNGVLTLTRINGEQINFNIAATQFYRNAIAAASQITLTLTSKDGVVIATATNSKGVTVTKSVNISDVGSGTITAIAESGNGVRVTESITIEAGGVPDIGITPSGCSGCKGECKGGCGSSCQSVCSHNCVLKCGAGCATTCWMTCEDDCDTYCTSTCKFTCYGGCMNKCGGCGNSCSGGCWVDCEDDCDTGCIGTCKGGCRGSCYKNCTGGCKGDCSGNCGYSCAQNTH